MRPKGPSLFDLSLLQRSKDFFGRLKEKDLQPFRPEVGQVTPAPDALELECGAHLASPSGANKGKIITLATPDLVARQFGSAWQLPLGAKTRARVPIDIPPFSQRSVGLLVRVKRDAEPGAVRRLHLVQRHRRSGQIVGGVAVEVRVAKPRAGLAGHGPSTA